jgi:hypothetical protein
MQQCLKAAAGAARAWIVAAQLFEQFFIAVDEPHATLDMGFGRVTLAAFAHRFKSDEPRRCEDILPYDTSVLLSPR